MRDMIVILVSGNARKGRAITASWRRRQPIPQSGVCNRALGCGVVTATNHLGARTMRAFLVLIGIVLVLAAGAMAMGWISIDQTRPAVVQAPTFRAEGPKVSVGTTQKTVEVPTVKVEKPADNAQ